MKLPGPYYAALPLGQRVAARTVARELIVAVRAGQWLDFWAVDRASDWTDTLVDHDAVFECMHQLYPNILWHSEMNMRREDSK